MWVYILIFLVIVIIVALIKKRGYFWKDKEGNKLSFRQFLGRWKDGVSRATPLQQTRIMLWSFIPVFAGVIWGIVITFMAGTYWMTLILAGSLPLVSVNFLGTYQRLYSLKKVDKLMKESQCQAIIGKEGVKKKRKKKNKKKRRK